MFRPRLRTLAAVGVGAVAAYLWDPDRGPERRAKLSEQLRSITQGTGTDATTPWTDTPASSPGEIRDAATGGPAVTEGQVADQVSASSSPNGR